MYGRERERKSKKKHELNKTGATGSWAEAKLTEWSAYRPSDNVYERSRKISRDSPSTVSGGSVCTEYEYCPTDRNGKERYKKHLNFGWSGKYPVVNTFQMRPKKTRKRD